MNHSVPGVRATDRPAGLIDTLQAGFNAVNRNVWLLILPLAVDLLLWQGPQPTAGLIVDQWLAQTPAPPVSAGLGPNFEQNRRASVDLVRNATADFNLLTFLILPGIGVNGVPIFQARGQGPVIPLDSGFSVVAVAAASMILGLTVAALFYGLLAQGVREGRVGVAGFLPDFAQLTVWLVALILMLVAVIVFAVAPITALYVASQSLGAPGATAGLASALAALFVGIALWAFVYMFFTQHALYVSRVPPLTAVRNSIRVVRYNFWSALGLMLLMLLISAGLSVLWQQLAVTVRTAGVPMGMAGHIYISAGLAAAGMTYYKERFDRLPPTS